MVIPAHFRWLAAPLLWWWFGCVDTAAAQTRPADSVFTRHIWAVGEVRDGGPVITRLHLDLDPLAKGQSPAVPPVDHVTDLSLRFLGSGSLESWLASVDSPLPNVHTLQCQCNGTSIAALSELLDRFPNLHTLRLAKSGTGSTEWNSVILPQQLRSLVVCGFVPNEQFFDDLTRVALESLVIVSAPDENLNLSLRHRAGLSVGGRLTTLNLDSAVERSSQVAAAPRARQLRELSISFAEVDSLSGMEQLESLTLEGCLLEASAIREIVGLPELEELTLLGCAMGEPLDFASLPKFSSRLRQVSMGRISARSELWQLLSLVPDQTRLSALAMRDIDTERQRAMHSVTICHDCDPEFVANLLSLPRLQSLDLIAKADLAQVAQILGHPSINEIELNVFLPEDSTSHTELIDRFRPGESLRKLSVVGATEWSGIIELASRVPNLESLTLRNDSNHSLRDTDVERLVRLQSLKQLNLSYSLMSHPAIQAVAEIPNLEHLDLTMTDADDDVLRVIAAMPHLHSLRIGWNPVTVRGFEHLQFGEGLRFLDVSGLALDVEAYEELRAERFVIGQSEWPRPCGSVMTWSDDLPFMADPER